MSALRFMTSRGRVGASAVAACTFALAFATAALAETDAQRATFRVTLSAKLTKTWDYVDSREEPGCTSRSRVRGSRTVTLRSARATVVVVTLRSGRLRFSPALVRSVTALTRQGGSVSRSGCGVSEQRLCAVQQRPHRNQTFSFFRSRPGEITFRPAREYAIASTCPPEDRSVRTERPDLDVAEGRLVERDLFNRRVRSLTVNGGYDEETQIEGGPEGTVLERVDWHLTFRRVS
jgi:hypothetical protein